MAKRSASKKKAAAPTPARTEPASGPPRKYEVEWVDIHSLKPKSFQNPNRMTPRQRTLLRKSIEQDGIVPPLLVWLETDEVIDGEHRWEIARDDLGWTTVPVVKQSMTPAQARIIARRRIHARGDEVEDFAEIVMKELADLDALDEAQDALLLSDEEIRRWDKEIEVEPLPIDEEVEEDNGEGEPDGQPAPRAAAPAAVEARVHVPKPPAAGAAPLEDIGPDLSASALEDAVEETADLDAPRPVRAERPRAAEDDDLDDLDEEEEEDDDAEERPRTAPKTHRVNVLFMGDEADLILRVLGRAPGARIVEMCRYWEKHSVDEKLLDEV